MFETAFKTESYFCVSRVVDLIESLSEASQILESCFSIPLVDIPEVLSLLWNLSSCTELDDALKVGVLKELPHAEDRLRLFAADIYDPSAFETAIEGCECVFHVATPLQHTISEQFKNTAEAAIAAAKSILESCIKSRAVKRLVYTATGMSASLLKEDGKGFKDFIDESCWTPLNHSFAYCDNFTSDYITSKTLAEQEVLKYNDKEKFGLDVVTLVCSLVVGDTLLPYLRGSQETIISPITGNPLYYKGLRLLQEMLGSIPLAHIDDVCEAHIFCMENPIINGRVLCAHAYPSLVQVADYYQEINLELRVAKEIMGEQESAIRGSSTKLTDLGFEYKYDMKKMLDDTVYCAKKLGSLQ